MFITSRASVLPCVSFTGCVLSAPAPFGAGNRFALYFTTRRVNFGSESSATRKQPRSRRIFGFYRVLLGFSGDNFRHGWGNSLQIVVLLSCATTHRMT